MARAFPLLLLLASRGTLAQDKPPGVPAIERARSLGNPPDEAAKRARALESISADSLKGHLSFLASDLLEGRDSPSRGLDLAAEYIAAQFRRAGLEAVGDDGYFQTADMTSVVNEVPGSRFTIAVEGRTIPVGFAEYSPISAPAAGLDVAAGAVVKVVPGAAAGLDPATVAGKVVLFELPDLRALAPGGPEIQAAQLLLMKLTRSRAALLVLVARAPRLLGQAGLGGRRLDDPESPGREPSPPFVGLSDPRLVAAFDALPPGLGPATASVHLPPATRRPARLRNVVGLLRGSDPALRDTCVMVTAHYDHLGAWGPEGTDRIFNGANDDGSGTVSVIELASAFAALKDARPRRSVLFVTFFGEEKGLVGSRHYGRHPVVPVEKTVADVNLELVGRTDDVEGPQRARASLTGFGYSEVSAVLTAAGAAEGVQVVKHPRNSDAFFPRSDNQALADLGVPAHTLCVAFEYPDYHGAADHWDKVDYANMARINRMVFRALLALADDPDEPKWDEANPRAAKYLKARKDRRGR